MIAASAGLKQDPQVQTRLVRGSRSVQLRWEPAKTENKDRLKWK